MGTFSSTKLACHCTIINEKMTAASGGHPIKERNPGGKMESASGLSADRQSGPLQFDHEVLRHLPLCVI
jgi:hypothetical protein